MTLRMLAACFVLAVSVPVAFVACGDDEDGGGAACSAPEDCDAVACEDGSTVRACISGECATDAADVCGGGGGAAGW